MLVRAGIKGGSEPECELPRELLYEFVNGQPSLKGGDGTQVLQLMIKL